MSVHEYRKSFIDSYFPVIENGWMQVLKVFFKNWFLQIGLSLKFINFPKNFNFEN